MLFNSATFAVFLVVVFVLYWAMDRRPLAWQNTWLLIASYIFYGWWDWRFLGLLALTSLVDYAIGHALGWTAQPGRRKALLAVSLAANLGVLAFFKYYGFFVASAAALLESLGLQPHRSTLNIILPVGISFYTFQSLSYTVDVYRRRIPAVSNLVNFLVFVSFFPQLVAGPIERAGHLLPQFFVRRRLSLREARTGLKEMLWGLFKKMAVADTLAPTVDVIFRQYRDLDGLTLAAGTFLFGIQVYADFSGYSEIARGTARLFGFQLMRNFEFPYFAASIPEFWRRWHISLSTWFRDYVYFPLGGNRGGLRRHLRNILATFIISGLWHGANWTFVIWGLLNGLYYVGWVLAVRAGSQAGGAGARAPAEGPLRGILLTNVLIMISWVFFRSASLSDTAGYLARLVTHPVGAASHELLVLPLSLAAGLLLIEWLQQAKAYVLELPRAPLPVRWALYYALVGGILVLHRGYAPFIYFQF